jgi:hypothetical protein
VRAWKVQLNRFKPCVPCSSDQRGIMELDLMSFQYSYSFSLLHNPVLIIVLVSISVYLGRSL